MFHAPPWGDPLDVEAVLAAIPKEATIKGIFLEATAKALPREDTTPRRDRYLAFTDYPLREHAELLVGVARAVHSQLPLRQGLRRIGRAATRVVLGTTYGKVVFAGAKEMSEALDALGKAYAVMAGGTVRVEELTPAGARVRIQNVYWFLDSHHVGVFEGVMSHVNVRGTVAVRLDSPSSGHFALSWGDEPAA